MTMLYLTKSVNQCNATQAKSHTPYQKMIHKLLWRAN